jgi:hypothetical protein
MDLAVVIFVSAVSGAVSSIVMQLIGKRISSSQSTGSSHTNTQQDTSSVNHMDETQTNAAQTEKNNVGQIDVQQHEVQDPKIDTHEGKEQTMEEAADNQTPSIVQSTKEESTEVFSKRNIDLASESEEEINEESIVTGSDLSHHVPKFAKFKDLNIPSIDAEVSVSEKEFTLSDSKIPKQETAEDSAAKTKTNAHSLSSIPNTVPEHAESGDDDATVLVERIPPK